jgi:hypothetical protein
MNTDSDRPTENSDAPNIESAIAGDYEFAIGEVLTEGWQKVSGLKGPFWAAAVIVFVVVLLAGLALSFVANFLGLLDSSGIGFLIPLLVQLAVMALMYPFMAGIVMLGVRRSIDLPISYNEIFAYFAFAAPLVAAAILMSILMILGFVLLIIPGIYLAVAYMFTVPLIVEKNLGFWEAMETSRKAITRHWFKFAFILIIMAIIFFISAIPLGLGLIWSYPMMIAVMGILYRETFGVDQTD